MVIGGGSAKRTNAGSSKRAAEPNARLAKSARRYGIARRVLCRWKQGPPLPSLGRRNSPPPQPKPRGGLAPLAGERSKLVRVRCTSAHAPHRSREKSSTAAAG